MSAYQTASYQQWSREAEVQKQLESQRPSRPQSKYTTEQLQQMAQVSPPFVSRTATQKTCGQNLDEIAVKASNESLLHTPITAYEPSCCPNSSSCPTDVQWQARFKGCSPVFANGPAMSCEVAPLGDRYWVADMNPLLYERQLISGAEWNPYQHFNARQMFTQFLTKDIRKTTDPYTRPIRSLDETYCQQLQTRGPPRFTSF